MAARDCDRLKGTDTCGPVQRKQQPGHSGNAIDVGQGHRKFRSWKKNPENALRLTALRDADTSSVAEAARKHGISEQSIHRWRKKFAGMEVTDVRELRRLREENARLKKLVAERDLEVEVMKEIQAKKW